MLPRARFSPPAAPRVDGRPLVLGHRGASADAPENTLAAFHLAMEQGADGVELDVWRCASGEPVVIHDVDARRTGGVRVDVTRASLRELAAIDVGSWRGTPWARERIPSLPQVLSALPRAVVNVELKSSGRGDARLARAVAQAIRSARAEGRVVVSSFDALLLAAFRLAAPEVPVGVLFDAKPRWQLAEALGRVLAPSAVHPEWRLLDDVSAARWHAAGLAINTWTVDAPEVVARACRLAATAVISNRPGAVRALVRRETGA